MLYTEDALNRAFERGEDKGFRRGVEQASHTGCEIFWEKQYDELLLLFQSLRFKVVELQDLVDKYEAQG